MVDKTCVCLSLSGTSKCWDSLICWCWNMQYWCSCICFSFISFIICKVFLLFNTFKKTLHRCYFLWMFLSLHMGLEGLLSYVWYTESCIALSANLHFVVIFCENGQSVCQIQLEKSLFCSHLMIVFLFIFC